MRRLKRLFCLVRGGHPWSLDRTNGKNFLWSLGPDYAGRWHEDWCPRCGSKRWRRCSILATDKPNGEPVVA